MARQHCRLVSRGEQPEYRADPAVPPSKRSFVVSLAALYRISTELVDVEPHRSVLVRRRIDTRIPSPALSTAVSGPAKPSGSFGGLTNLRAPASSASAAASSSAGWGNAAGTSGTGSGAWGKASGGGGNKAYAHTLSAPGSGAATPGNGPSRPATPLAGGAAAQTGQSGAVVQVPVPVPHDQKVVGEVGKVEDDEDWDVDA